MTRDYRVCEEERFNPSLPKHRHMFGDNTRRRTVPVEQDQLIHPSPVSNNDDDNGATKQQEIISDSWQLLFPPNSELLFDIFGETKEEQIETLRSIYASMRDILISHSRRFREHTGLTSDRNQMFQSLVTTIQLQQQTEPRAAGESFTTLLRVWFPEWQWDVAHGGFFSETPDSQTIGDRLDKINDALQKNACIVL